MSDTTRQTRWIEDCFSGCDGCGKGFLQMLTEDKKIVLVPGKYTDTDKGTLEGFRCYCVACESKQADKLWAVLDEALEHGDIAGGMYRERTMEGAKIGEDTPMWMGPMKRNGACMSAKALAEELLRDGFREKGEGDE